MRHLVREAVGRFSGLARYTLLSATAAVFELSLLFLLTSVLHIYYIYSVVIAYLCAITLHFILIKFIGFRDQGRRIMRQVARFLAVNLIGLCLTLILMFILVEYVHLWYLFSRVVSLLIVLIYSYTMHKRITFGVAT